MSEFKIKGPFGQYAEIKLSEQPMWTQGPNMEDVEKELASLRAALEQQKALYEALVPPNSVVVPLDEWEAQVLEHAKTLRALEQEREAHKADSDELWKTQAALAAEKAAREKAEAERDEFKEASRKKAGWLLEDRAALQAAEARARTWKRAAKLARKHEGFAKRCMADWERWHGEKVAALEKMRMALRDAEGRELGALADLDEANARAQTARRDALTQFIGYLTDTLEGAMHHEARAALEKVRADAEKARRWESRALLSPEKEETPRE